MNSALGVAALAAALVVGPVLPSASAAPDPCAASEVARTVAEVATYTGNYLEANPKANRALTSISQQGGPESIAALKTYFDANPQVASDLQRLQAPLATLSGRCRLPVTLPQIFGLMQAAQQTAAQPVAHDAAPPPR